VASLLLVPLLLRSGIPRAGAVGGAVFFLLHPANVEAVAWISQLKSSSSMVLSPRCSCWRCSRSRRRPSCSPWPS
jgi:hypothetical protein